MHSGTLPTYTGIDKTVIFPGVPAEQLAEEMAHLPPKVPKDQPLRFTLYVTEEDNDLGKNTEECVRKVIVDMPDIDFDVIDKDSNNERIAHHRKRHNLGATPQLIVDYGETHVVRIVDSYRDPIKLKARLSEYMERFEP